MKLIIRLTIYNDDYRKSLENYPLSEEHLSFTGHPLELLERAQVNVTYTPIIITEDDQVAGFFVLDTGADKFHYTDIPESILLRGYSIHPAYQGRGIAQKSMKLLQTFVAKHFSDINRIVLGVNEANKAAQTVYAKSGFIDEGRRFNGRSGIQIAMSLSLDIIEVRMAQAGDEHGIVDVCIAAQWNTYKDLYSNDYIEGIIAKFYTVERISKEIKDTNRSWNGYFVAQLNEEIVGAIGGGVDEDGVAEVYVLYLHPAKRGQGIGTKLLSYLTEIQRAEYGAHEQWVSVTEGNQLGIPFYEAREFTFQYEQQAYESEAEDNAVSLKYKRFI